MGVIGTKGVGSKEEKKIGKIGGTSKGSVFFDDINNKDTYVVPECMTYHKTKGFGKEDKEVFYERNSQIRRFPEKR